MFFASESGSCQFRDPCISKVDTGTHTWRFGLKMSFDPFQWLLFCISDMYFELNRKNLLIIKINDWLSKAKEGNLGQRLESLWILVSDSLSLEPKSARCRAWGTVCVPSMD